MPRLIVHPDTSRAVEIPLVRGVTTLGRNTENHHAFDDPSVSGSHFQLSVTNAGTTVRDLGSTNGTFVDGNRIEEVILLPGQTIRAGEVSMRYEADYEATVGAPARSTQVSGDGACFNHPKKPARYVCLQCKGLFCEHCVTTRKDRGRGKKLCIICLTECLDLSPRTPAHQEREPFAKQIRGAFAYPLQGDGLILLVVGTVFFGVVGFAAAFALFLGLIVRIFLAGYLVVYGREILRSSANGEKAMPPWPDIEHVSEYRMPLVEFYGTLLLCFLPVTAVGFLHPRADPWHPYYMIIAAIPGLIYGPMAMTAVTMFDSISGVNPRLVLPSIWRVRKSYLLLLGALLVVFVAVLALQWISRQLPIPILPSLVGGVLNIYLLAVTMRLCGLLYRAEETKLAWF